jgi:hypothetical protein
MNVKHKITGETYECIGEWKDYYMVKTDDGDIFARAKSSYEPVPTARWVDVTAECDVNGIGDIRSGSVIFAAWNAAYGRALTQDEKAFHPYRLVKVEPCEMDMRPKAYFVVEQKVSK